MKNILRMTVCIGGLMMAANCAFAEGSQSDAEAEGAVLGLLALSCIGIAHSLYDMKRLRDEQPYHSIRMEDIGWKKNKRKNMSIVELAVCGIAAAGCIILMMIYG